MSEATTMPAAVFTVTKSELQMLNELASATRDTEVRGTSAAVAAVNALLVHELAGHAREMVGHLARLASTVTSPTPMVAPALVGTGAAGAAPAARNPAAFLTNSALDAPSIAGIATRFTEVVHTTIQPQITTLQDTTKHQSGQIDAVSTRLTEAVQTTLQPQITTLQDTVKHQSGQIDAVGTRLTEAVHTTLQPQITALQDTVRHQSEHIDALRRAMRPVEPEIEAAATELGHVENHLRRLQEHHDTLSFRVRDLAENLPRLIEAECREICRQHAAGFETMMAEAVLASRAEVERVEASCRDSFDQLAARCDRLEQPPPEPQTRSAPRKS